MPKRTSFNFMTRDPKLAAAQLANLGGQVPFTPGLGTDLGTVNFAFPGLQQSQQVQALPSNIQAQTSASGRRQTSGAPAAPIPNTSTGSQQRTTLSVPAAPGFIPPPPPPIPRRAEPVGTFPPAVPVTGPGFPGQTGSGLVNRLLAGQPSNLPGMAQPTPMPTPTPVPAPVPGQGQAGFIPPTQTFGGGGVPGPVGIDDGTLLKFKDFLFNPETGNFQDASIPALLAGLARTVNPFTSSPVPLALTDLAFQNLTASPEQRFNDLPFSQFIQQAIESGQIPGAGDTGTAGQFLETAFQDALSGSSLPFRDDLESLVSQLGDPNASVFGPGLTEQERAAQTALLQSTLDDSRDDLFRDLLADSARRGMTTADAPALENLARFDERSAELAADLANQQLLQDMQLRRDAGRLGLERQLGAAGIAGGQQLRDIQGALGLGNLALGTAGLGQDTAFRSFEDLAQLASQERALSNQMGQQAFQNAFQIPSFAASAGLNFLNSNRDADFIRQSIERGDAAGFGAFATGNNNSPFGIDFNLPNIGFPNPTGPRFDIFDFTTDEDDLFFAGVGGRPPAFPNFFGSNFFRRGAGG